MAPKLSTDQSLQEIYNLLRRNGFRVGITLTLIELPATLWAENEIKPTVEMKAAVEEAKKIGKNLNHVTATTWSLCVVAGGMPIVRGGLHALTATEACTKMLALTKRFVRSYRPR